MDGLIIVNKPVGITSQNVDYQIKKIFNIKKVGHIGTLDPIASGVLVVAMGSATKIINFLEDGSKTYKATICFGIATDTFDITGTIIDKLDDFILNEDLLDNAINKFVGEIEQTPPIYSAIKVAGKKLYEYARKNQEVEIPTRKVTINYLKRTSNIYVSEGKYCCDIICDVSKGTYIRSLIFDIGKTLNIPSCMMHLERTRSGNFKIENSSSLEDISIGNYSLINMLDAIDIFTIDLSLSIEVYEKIKNGMKLSTKLFDKKHDRIAFSYNGDLIAIYEYANEPYPCYKPLRVWN